MCQSGKHESLFTGCMSKACRQNCPCSSHRVKSQFLEPLSILIDSGVSGFSCDKSLEALKHLGKMSQKKTIAAIDPADISAQQPT